MLCLKKVPRKPVLSKTSKGILFLGTVPNSFSYFLLTQVKSYGSFYMQGSAGKGGTRQSLERREDTIYTAKKI